MECAEPWYQYFKTSSRIFSNKIIIRFIIEIDDTTMNILSYLNFIILCVFVIKNYSSKITYGLQYLCNFIKA